jgi:hypothetical protein
MFGSAHVSGPARAEHNAVVPSCKNASRLIFPHSLIRHSLQSRKQPQGQGQSGQQQAIRACRQAWASGAAGAARSDVA